MSAEGTAITPLELQTSFYDISAQCNMMPISVSKPRADGGYDILTPNDLMMGRSTLEPPDDTDMA